MSDTPGSKWHGTRLRVAATTLTAAADGAVFGTALASDGPDPRRDDGPPRVALASGVARLPLPTGWEPLHRRSSLPGLRDATAVRGVHSAVALDIRAPEDSSLLPAGVVAASAGDLPAPRLRHLDGRRAWRYELPGARPWTWLVALTLPTTRGVVTIACEADAAAIGGARDECEGAMGALQLDGAAELAPAPETAALIVLPATVARLNRQRRSGRRALAAATLSPRIRSEAARRLARAYVTAADRLRPLAGGEARRLIVACDELARQHRALALASERRDARSARRAAAAIDGEERRLAPLLAAIGRRGTQPTARSA